MQDLTYSVVSNTEKGKTIQLLSGVTGYFQPSKMAALVSVVLVFWPDWCASQVRDALQT
jgi:hypothetical protein